MGTSKLAILADERSELVSNPASLVTEIHISGQGRRQIWIFSARKSNSPLKQRCELGSRFPGHWSCPLSVRPEPWLFLWGSVKSNMVRVHSTHKQINSTDPWSCWNCAYRDVM